MQFLKWPKTSLLVGFAALALTGCGDTGKTLPPIEVAPEVDMKRVYGGWYILATIPNSFEKGMVELYDEYSPRPDGDIREDFYVREHSFTASRDHYTVHDWTVPGSHNARWRVQILWPIDLPFLVLYVDPDYRFILYGEENRELGWIYAREPRISDADWDRLMGEFRRRGYDTTQFKRFVQFPDQIGKPGFWSDGVTP